MSEIQKTPGIPLFDLVLEVAEKIADQGGRPDLIVANRRDYLQLMEESSRKGKPGMIEGPTGPMRLLYEAEVPANMVYVLEEGTLEPTRAWA